MGSDTIRTSATLCAYPACTRTVWQDPDGSYSSYCGRTHMESATKTLQREYICQNCQAKPVYVENNKRHEFCGKRCATAYRSSSSRSQMMPMSNADAMCRLPGCVSSAFKDGLGHVGEYCSHPHRREGVKQGISEACLHCGIWPRNVLNDKFSDFCSRSCVTKAIGEAPVILEIPCKHEAYEQVSRQFYDQWKHPTPKPPISKIWKVYGSKAHNDRFSRYKLAVERSTGLDGGNTCRRWHGTARACTLGDKSGSKRFCSKKDCSVCSILKSSFELAHYKRSTNFGRFGAGIYTSATSSKSSDYISQRATSPYQAILLSEVVMGKTIKLTTNHLDLTEPPKGYDAVEGEPGDVLNYDESVVYRNDAIRPLYLILFEKTPSTVQTKPTRLRKKGLTAQSTNQTKPTKLRKKSLSLGWWAQ